MNNEAKKVVLSSVTGYSKEYDSLLKSLIDDKILLFCAVGKDCELWHDIMDELDVMDELNTVNGEERDFFMITTWHEDATLDEVIEFARSYDIEGIDNGKLEIIEI